MAVSSGDNAYPKWNIIYKCIPEMEYHIYGLVVGYWVEEVEEQERLSLIHHIINVSAD